MKTKDYSLFKLVSTNRIITKAHINKIINSIKTYGYFNSKPITVNSKMEISDGQHRFLACKELNIPIVYEIDDMNVNDTMVVLNTTSNVWRLNEFIDHYAAKGIENYIELKNFIKISGYGVSNCISIYCSSINGNAKNIRSGKLDNKNQKINEVVELIEFFKGKVSFYLTSHFVRSIACFININSVNKKHIDKLKLNCYSIIQCATTEQYINQYKKLTKLNN